MELLPAEAAGIVGHVSVWVRQRRHDHIEARGVGIEQHSGQNGGSARRRLLVQSGEAVAVWSGLERRGPAAAVSRAFLSTHQARAGRRTCTRHCATMSASAVLPRDLRNPATRSPAHRLTQLISPDICEVYSCKEIHVFGTSLVEKQQQLLIHDTATLRSDMTRKTASLSDGAPSPTISG
eukprot:scaffold3737_cov80-Phaeocystis_antarctica.AAC.1